MRRGHGDGRQGDNASDRKDLLRKIGQLIFIRHGEKIDDEHPGLAKQGKFRAEKLHLVFGKGNTPPGKYNTPDIIYAMKTKDEAGASTRPFDTVAPLGRTLKMEPIPGERTGQDTGRIFDARFEKKEVDELFENVAKHADDEYKGKTILFCWEHKTIPLIVDAFGLNPLDEPLYWGSNPEAEEDEPANYNAIWVFTPGLKMRDPNYFRVYQEFVIDPNQCDALGHIPQIKDAENVLFTAKDPPGGYGQEVYTYNPKDDSDRKHE